MRDAVMSDTIRCSHESDRLTGGWFQSHEGSVGRQVEEYIRCFTIRKVDNFVKIHKLESVLLKRQKVEISTSAHNAANILCEQAKK